MRCSCHKLSDFKIGDKVKVIFPPSYDQSILNMGGVVWIIGELLVYIKCYDGLDRAFQSQRLEFDKS